jgi:hypothetical protein
VSRNVRIEEILEAWFEADHSPESERAVLRRQRDDIIRKYLRTNPFTVDQVLDCLHSQYQDYRRDRKLKERLSGGQQSRKK